MSRDAIYAAIPHRPPMLLVDAIVSQQDQQIVCQKTFQADEWFFQGHYPDYPIVPGVILCEAAMQAGAILLSRHLTDVTNAVPVATRMNDVKFKRMIRPGDTVEMSITLDERMADAFYLTAKLTCQGAQVARFQFACTMAPRHP